MSTRMLIDARHSEETRVAIVKGSRVEDFDYESAAKRQIKGNIYLARITRVEPSLQACFVEYGGNRHGFLAFSEIHPDYYQIPVEDREELIKLENEEELAQAKAALENGDKKAKPSKSKPKTANESNSDPENDNDTDIKSEEVSEKSVSQSVSGNDDSDDSEKVTEDSPAAEQDEEIEAAENRRNMRALTRRYKIQEVIKRRQVMLIQVVKEERGNKGAALTTYISLAGRYCVLMPNSTHSGGISRKISNVADRKRLKSMMTSLNLPQGMGCIVRTAGMARTKTEVKRDLDYLLRLWNGIRDLTLKSVAPASVYEEGNLIKRSIRDLYSKDIDEILVEGTEGYNIAKNFITMLMPSHAKKVSHYKEGAIPLFHRYQVETQLEAMYNPSVQLKSGGYIVINPTEALISVDVNSGRATKEKNIEETAVKTNLEAAEELGRQLRLRDMAGLIVIDFIDMEDRGNNRAVERRLKDVLKSDRARIQVGRMSSFGLLEMSRQRLRPNLLEASMMVCTHCDGSGVVRNVESAALQSLRALEEEGIRGRSAHLKVSLNRDVAIYMLNKKRADIYDLEKRYALEIEVHGRRDLGPSDIEVERENITPVKDVVSPEALMTQSIVMDPLEDGDNSDTKDRNQSEGSNPRTRTRRRRRRRGGRDEDTVKPSENNESNEPSESTETPETTEEQLDKPKSKRRRGRRGGRRRKNNDKRDSNSQEHIAEPANNSETDVAKPDSSPAPALQTDTQVAENEKKADTKAKPPRRRRSSNKTKKVANDESVTTESKDVKAVVSDDSSSIEDKPKSKPKPTRRPRRAKKTDEDKVPEESVKAKSSKEKAALDTENTVTKEAKAEEKPKAKRRPRRTKAVIEAEKAEKAKDTDKTKPSDSSKADKPKRGRPKKQVAANKTDANKETEKTKEPVKKVQSKATETKPVKKEAVKPPKTTEKDDAEPKKPSKSGWWDKNFG